MPLSILPKEYEKLYALVKERHNVTLKRAAGLPKPWTTDIILQTYRFPNMFRELDKVTKWIADNWRIPNATEPDVWFAMAVARFCNWPESLAEIGYPVPWVPGRYIDALEARKARGDKVFTGAYVLAAGGEGGSKIRYIAEKVLSNMWTRRNDLRPTPRDTLASFYERIHDCHGVGTFMAAQIIADAKYTDPLLDAPDWWTWAAPGPGSCRGLNRLVGRPVNASWKHEEWLRLINRLREKVTADFAREGLLSKGFPVPHAQDSQGFCCEYDKYERTRLGEGTPRSLYPGK